MQDLSPALAQAVRSIAARLGRGGHRTWIVGGAVRDLALGRETHDVDLASAATPEVVEAAFERTVPLGRNFGTVLVHVDGEDVEHTTFRSEDGYSDARRPDAVTFGSSPEEDATRRDFTCNALYLDPLDGTVLDPTGGLADLEAGRLACVGDPAQRFAEDGLRIVRMARFAGQLGLEPTEATRAGALASLDALRGVSPERVRAELERRLAVLERLPQAPGAHLGFAALLGPDELGEESAWEEFALEERIALVEGLRPSRALRDHVGETWRLARGITLERAPPRSVRVRWMRRPAFADALALVRAHAPRADAGARALDELGREHADLAATEQCPFLSSSDLSARGLSPGPAFGAILREAETLQLDGDIATRDEALRWLEARLKADAATDITARDGASPEGAGLEDRSQEGGNARRNA